MLSTPPGSYYGYETMNEVLASAPRGFPRPVVGGLPHPWIANLEELSDANAFRRAACVMLRLCQVCGLELDEYAVVCWRKDDQFVVDGAAIHPQRCWPLAKAKCPELARMVAAGILVEAQVRSIDLEIVTSDEDWAIEGLPVGYRVPSVANDVDEQRDDQQHRDRDDGDVTDADLGRVGE